MAANGLRVTTARGTRSTARPLTPVDHPSDFTVKAKRTIRIKNFKVLTSSTNQTTFVCTTVKGNSGVFNRISQGFTGFSVRSLQSAAGTTPTGGRAEWALQTLSRGLATLPAALQPERAPSSRPLVPGSPARRPRGAARAPEVASRSLTPILHYRSSMAKTQRSPSSGTSCTSAAGQTVTDMQAESTLGIPARQTKIPESEGESGLAS